MRQTIFAGPGKPILLQDVPMPQPGAGQALIRVERCGICGSDLHMTSGSAFDYPIGIALGHEYAGEIVELGADETALRVGDRVTAVPMSGCGTCPACVAGTPLFCPSLRPMTGGYGEYMLTDLRVTMKLPDELSYTHGALVEPVASALRGVRRLAIPAGARVAVVGVGAIGAAAIFWARRFGAERVAGVARSRRGEALARALGADAFVTTGDDLFARLQEELGGAPDIIIECIGVPGALQQAVELVRTGGDILSLGGSTAPDTIFPVLAMMKEVRIQFSVAYSPADFRYVLHTMANGGGVLGQIAGETISLDELPARFEAMRTGSHPARVMVAPMRS
jgi:threonine dehydrogenase-like Zn-dependent dehydrogenase